MPQNGLTRRDLYCAILFAAIVYLAMRFIYGIADVLLVFSITLLAVTLLNPMVSWLECRRIPRNVSTSLLALSVVGIIALGLFYVIPLAAKQFTELMQQMPESIAAGKQWFTKFAASYPAIKDLSSSIDISSISHLKPFIGGATIVTASIAGLFTAIFLAFISTIYILSDPKPLTNGILLLFNTESRQNVINAAERLGRQIQAWGKGMLVGMFAIFLLTWIALSIIGIKQAFLFAVIAGLMEAVPVLGPLLSAVPPIIVALTYDPILALWVIVAFIIIQQFESNILVPMVMSKQLSLHPVVVIFAVVVMGGMFGIVGVFLATPATATVAVLFDELYIRRQARKLETQAQQPEDSSEA